MQTAASEKLYNYRSITVKKQTASFLPILSEYFLHSKTLTRNSLKKRTWRNFGEEKFIFSILFPIRKLIWSSSFMSFKDFLKMLLFLISFLLQFSQFLYLVGDYSTYSCLLLRHQIRIFVLVIAFLLLNLFKFRYFSFLKDFVKKKVILSIFLNV